MVTVTVSVPFELKNKMEEFSDVNWSEVARRAFSEKVRDLSFLKEFTRDSTLTEKDAIEIGRKVNAGLAKRHSVK